jgi:phosphoserine aminotransferase
MGCHSNTFIGCLVMVNNKPCDAAILKTASRAGFIQARQQDAYMACRLSLINAVAFEEIRQKSH